MKHKTKIVGIALLCFALGSAALTLGRVRGAALIGKPLDVVVPIQMDAGEDAAALCFAAEVFHADTLQDASRVRVLVQISAQAQSANVRVLSATPIDEPVVTVDLHTGCSQKTTRRYVLLADLPSPVETPMIAEVDGVATPVLLPELVATAAVPATINAPAASATPIPLPLPEPRPVTKARPTLSPKPNRQPRAASKQTAVKKGVVSTKTVNLDKKAKVETPSGQPRLKLDSTEPRSKQSGVLESSTAVAPSEDVLLNLKKMQTLEADLKALRISAAKTEANLVDLRARLQKAEAERFTGFVILGLVALVLAALAALAWFWQRQHRHPTGDKDWWSGAATTQTPLASTSGAELQAASKSALAATYLNEAGPSSEVDVSMIEMGESAFDADDLRSAGEPHPGKHKHEPSASVRPAPENPLDTQTMAQAPELDLDLSDLEPSAVRPSSAATTELELPSLSVAAQTGTTPVAAVRPDEDKNLIDFDFLEAPKPVVSTDHKPA